VSVFVVFFKPQFNSIDKHQYIGACTRGESQTPIRVIFECASDSESTRLCACMSRTHSGHPIRWIAYNRSHLIILYFTSNLKLSYNFCLLAMQLILLNRQYFNISVCLQVILGYAEQCDF